MMNVMGSTKKKMLCSRAIRKEEAFTFKYSVFDIEIIEKPRLISLQTELDINFELSKIG